MAVTTGSVTRIAGTLTNNGILRAAYTPNTIEYNGTDQTVINPNGLSSGILQSHPQRYGNKSNAFICFKC